ncbi:C2H2 transcription factor (Rpn4), putative [Talaromyces marneffei ATCC 18224]|uniref:C2H2 transcription factor (Rpn4), putative n=1 Tax=Talaromyces marneffei (strain ATCC 18224 / CBS 334.59 / QM 7333) TaxID=441960 RepID=B6QCA8_TALMQ|nr:C2H2 transcription factor (Rpn4), putative [Talaromyces marneffei ATCC 18224]
MLLYPTVRNKDLITHAQWPYPINNTADLDILQDGQLPPDLLVNNIYGQDISQQTYQSQRQSPFNSPELQFLPSSGCSSPAFSSFSPAFSSDRSPVTNFSGDFPIFDGSWSEAPSMSVASSYNPAFHLAPPAPSPYPNAQYSTPQYLAQHSPMLAQSGISTNTYGSWDTDTNSQLLSPAHAQKGAHKRAASGSSGKTGSNSPQTATAFAGQYQNSNPKKSLPTPVQTPVQNSFLAPAFQNYDPLTHNGDTAAAEQAMRQAVMEQHSHGSNHNNNHPTAEDDTSFHYSLPPSVSSLSHHNSPVTPQTTYDELDDGSKAVVHGEDRSPDFDRWMGDYLQFDANPDFNNQTSMSMGVPKLNRTISEIYQDELYNTNVVPASSQQMRKANTNMGSAPYRNLFADRLNAANQGHLSARSQSPAGTSVNRERSPFRQGSPLAADFQHQQSHLASGLGSALQLQEGEIKTISPKDALLEYNEGPDDLANGLPSLFPTNDMTLGGSDMTSRRQSATSAFQPTLAYNSMETFPTQYATQAAGLQQPMNNFMQPQLPTQNLHANNTLLQQTPGFPASLPSMESTNSDRMMETPSKRPNDTSSDSGTYTCTYHGCTLRFETPAKLQKHKREAHRQTMAGDTNPSLALRNSQAGPHKCERINPSTGKPCNSIFSRPYDLTRHEDTIHNARKQKVRCHLCTEEKTFSRNDALTRHMRVVHPEVDWPGKQRRKGH